MNAPRASAGSRRPSQRSLSAPGLADPRRQDDPRRDRAPVLLHDLARVSAEGSAALTGECAVELTRPGPPHGARPFASDVSMSPYPGEARKRVRHSWWRRRAASAWVESWGCAS